MEPLDLSAIEEDADLEAEGITPYWAGVVKQLVAEAKQVQMAEEALRDARATIENLEIASRSCRNLVEATRCSPVSVMRRTTFCEPRLSIWSVTTGAKRTHELMSGYAEEVLSA